MYFSAGKGINKTPGDGRKLAREQTINLIFIGLPFAVNFTIKSGISLVVTPPRLPLEIVHGTLIKGVNRGLFQEGNTATISHDWIQLIPARQRAINSQEKTLFWRWYKEQSTGSWTSFQLFMRSPSLVFPAMLMRSLKCSSFSPDSPAGVGMQDPCSSPTPAGKAKRSSPPGVRTLKEESPAVTVTSAGPLATPFLCRAEISAHVARYTQG